MERIAVYFHRNLDEMPEVLALRADFPRVPHTNLRTVEYPKSLCLYDEPFRDIKRHWTPHRFVERIREWLALTAKGKLHQDDQPLEPILVGCEGTVVLPADMIDDSDDERFNRLTITAIESASNKMFLIGVRTTQSPRNKDFRAIASVHWCEPQEHGVIRYRPGNVKELASFVAQAGIDLLSEFRTQLLEWQVEASKDQSLLESHVAIIIVMPKTRRSGRVAESREVRAFFSTDTIREAGQKLGIWQIEGGEIGLIVGGDHEKSGEDLKIELLNPSFRLSRESAAALNGIPPKAPKIVAVGAGALGSQVTMNLARAGFGNWTIVDDDRLLPHNVARHALDGKFIGFPKAEAIAYSANSLIDGEKLITPIVADFIDPKEKSEEVNDALKDAELVLDMSASVSVARYLSLNSDITARKASLFMTPTGDDLVLLAEGTDKNSPIDSLEMQYYRAIATDDRLSGHFQPRDQRRRYGQSCRDITSDLPQELVALHAAIGSRAVRATLANSAAHISVWRVGNDGSVIRVDIEVDRCVRFRVGEWTVSLDSRLLKDLATIRSVKLPNETGGVLLGSFDLENKVIYIAHTIASPPDSDERPQSYIRGCKGLNGQVKEISRLTDGMLEYIGEWHSHPSNSSTAPSDYDVQLFDWLSGMMNDDGLPALMLIVGDSRQVSCFVGKVTREENLIPEGPEDLS